MFAVVISICMLCYIWNSSYYARVIIVQVPQGPGGTGPLFHEGSNIFALTKKQIQEQNSNNLTE